MYVCDNCGQESAKWIGKCPACGQWNTFKEIKVADTRKQVTATSAAASAGHQLPHGIPDAADAHGLPHRCRWNGNGS